MQNIEYLKQYLISHEIKSSTIRLNALDYLLKNRIHPTADDIYEAVAKNIPTLSKTSIYNTIDLFLEKGIIQALDTGEKEHRFDIEVSTHGHFLCRNCNKIFDFNIDSIKYDQSKLDDFLIEERKVLFKGICKNCQDS